MIVVEEISNMGGYFGLDLPSYDFVYRGNSGCILVFPANRYVGFAGLWGWRVYMDLEISQQ